MTPKLKITNFVIKVIDFINVKVLKNLFNLTLKKIPSFFCLFIFSGSKKSKDNAVGVYLVLCTKEQLLFWDLMWKLPMEH